MAANMPANAAQAQGGPETEQATPPGQVITFYSYAGTAGRTMAVANVAWILASNGLRVLAVDWHLESPGLHRYFQPFLRDKDLRSSPGVIDMIREFSIAAVNPDGDDASDWSKRYSDVRRYVVSLDWRFPDQGGLDFLPAGRQDPPYATRMNTFDWNAFYRRYKGRNFIRAIRQSMIEHYDYVLVNSPSGLVITAATCATELADVVVDCFAMSSRSIDGAVAVAESIRARAVRSVRVLPVPLSVDDVEPIKLRVNREHARRRFEAVVDQLRPADVDRYWNDVEIPKRSAYSYEEVPAVFGDRDSRENSLRAAFERLTGVITEGRVIGMPAIEEQARRDRLAEFERSSPGVENDILVSYVGSDRPWARWVEAELRGAGLTVTLRDANTIARTAEDIGATPSRVLVLLSRAYMMSSGAAEFWRITVADWVTLGAKVTALQLDSAARTGVFFDLRTEHGDLVRKGEDECRAALFADIGVRPVTDTTQNGSDVPSVRFPTSPPAISNLPRRHPSFTGRLDQLAALREALSSNITVAVPQALFGLGGVGKTQVVLEYAYRFASEYDVIWWIAAEQATQARSGLAELAERLKLPTGSSTSETVQTVLDALRRGRPHARWLLIFDNADDPESVGGLLPTGSGHVIVTSRNPAWAAHADAVEVGEFRRFESIACLQAGVPRLTDEDADQVAERLGDLPLAIEQAGAWLATTSMPVATYLEMLDNELLETLNRKPPQGYPTSVTAGWLLSLRRLRETTPAAAKLLELCAFFAPEPIPNWLLRSDRCVNMLLDFDPSLRDPMLQDKMMRDIGRYALASIDDSGKNGTTQLHRLVRDVIRENLTPAQRDETRVQVHDILAAANPKDADEPAWWTMYRQLWPHLVPTGALQSTAPDVRQLVVDMVRFLWKRNDYSSSQELAEAALAEWALTFPDDDPTTLLLRVTLANSVRSQADYQRAYDLDTETMNKMADSPVLGPLHPYTLAAASGLAADERALGHYEAAHKLDEDTFRRLEDVFGESHPRTLMSAHNLAVSLRLVGDFRGATQLDQLTLERRRRVLGDRHPYTLFSANDLGRDLRDIGNFRRSRDLLEQTLAEYRKVMGDENAETLWTAKNLAVTMRKLGEFLAAKALTEQTLALNERLHDANHPDTLACRLNLGCDMSALGNHERAKQIVEETHDRYIQVLGDNHPFTVACANNLSIFARKTHDINRARTLSEAAVANFRATLGDHHPYTLACRINLINDLYSAQEYQEAHRLDTEVYGLTVAALGEDHPDTLAAANNLAISRRAVNDRRGWQTLRNRTLERSGDVLGEDHPTTKAVLDGERLNCDIEPPPT